MQFLKLLDKNTKQNKYNLSIKKCLKVFVSELNVYHIFFLLHEE